MARIRSLKPEFWTDGDVMDLSPHARMLFAGSWNFTLCDYGHLPDDPRRLKMQVLPADNVMMVRDPGVEFGWRLEWLDPAVLVEEIVASGRFARIEVEGRSYLHVVRFTDHQRLEKRWTPRCPVCKAASDHPEPRGTSREVARARATSTQDRTGQDRTSAAAAADAAAAAEKLPTSIAILRDKLHTHTALQALRFDGLTGEKQDWLLDLIQEHGDQKLIDTALRTLRTPPPVHVSAFLGTWAALPEPGQRLRVVEAECDVHPGQTASRCSGCAADRLAGDA